MWRTWHLTSRKGAAILRNRLYAPYKVGDIVALEWGRYRPRTISVRHSDWRGQLTSPKNGRGRFVAMTERGANVPTGVHILRHTFCSHLVMRGAAMRAVRELVRHSDLTMTQRYAHLSPAALVNTIRFLESRVADSGRGDILDTALVTMLARRSTRRWFSPFFCATVSVALGAAYMYAAGAPSHYLLVNFSALAAGLLAASLVRSALVLNQQVLGTFTVAVGLVLLATALVGHDVDGASRWVRIAGISFQPSLILLPLVMVLFAGNRYWLSSIGLLLAGAALAFQPDRAVAGALTAGLAVLWVYRRDAWVTLSLVGASCGFAATLVRDDHVPPVPFVEHVVQSAFAFDALYGLAIVVALVISLIPAIVGVVTETEDVVEYAVFGTTWLALIAFALGGNYPTPLAGYGTSGIVGYCLSSALLARRRDLPSP